MEELGQVLVNAGYDTCTFSPCFRRPGLSFWGHKADNQAVFNVYCSPKNTR